MSTLIMGQRLTFCAKAKDVMVLLGKSHSQCYEGTGYEDEL